MPFTFKFTTRENMMDVSYEYDAATQTMNRTEPALAGLKTTSYTANDGSHLWKANLGGPEGPEGDLVWLKVDNNPCLCFFTREYLLYFNGQTVETCRRDGKSRIETTYTITFPNEGELELFREAEIRQFVADSRYTESPDLDNAERQKLLNMDDEALKAKARKQDEAEQLRRAKQDTAMFDVAQRLMEPNVDPFLITLEHRLEEIGIQLVQLNHLNSALNRSSNVNENNPNRVVDGIIARYDEIKEEVTQLERELAPGILRLHNDNPLRQRYDRFVEGFRSISANNNMGRLRIEIRAKAPISQLEYDLDRLKLDIKQLEMMLNQSQRKFSLRQNEELKVKILRLADQVNVDIAGLNRQLLQKRNELSRSLPQGDPLLVSLNQRLDAVHQALSGQSALVSAIDQSLQRERVARAPAATASYSAAVVLPANPSAPQQLLVQPIITYAFNFAVDAHGRSSLQVLQNATEIPLREHKWPNANYVGVWKLSAAGNPGENVRDHFILWDKCGPKGELIRFIPGPRGDFAQNRYEKFSAAGNWEPVPENQKKYYVAMCQYEVGKFHRENRPSALGNIEYNRLIGAVNQIGAGISQLLATSPHGSQALVNEINTLWRSFNNLPLGKAGTERVHAMHSATLPALQERVKASLTANLEAMNKLQSIVDTIGERSTQDEIQARLDAIDPAEPGDEPHDLMERAKILKNMRDDCLQAMTDFVKRIEKDGESLQSLNLMQIEVAERVRANPVVEGVVVEGVDVTPLPQNPQHYNLTSGQYRFKIVPVANVESEISQLGSMVAQDLGMRLPPTVRQVTNQQAVIHMPGNGTAFVETSTSIKLTNVVPAITKAELDATAIDIAKKMIAKSNEIPYLIGTDAKYVPQLELMWKQVYARTGKEPLLNQPCALKIDSEKRTELIKDAMKLRSELIRRGEVKEGEIGVTQRIDEAYRSPSPGGPRR